MQTHLPNRVFKLLRSRNFQGHVRWVLLSPGPLYTCGLELNKWARRWVWGLCFACPGCDGRLNLLLTVGAAGIWGHLGHGKKPSLSRCSQGLGTAVRTQPQVSLFRPPHYSWSHSYSSTNSFIHKSKGSRRLLSQLRTSTIKNYEFLMKKSHPTH